MAKVAIAPVILRHDQPEIVRAAIGVSPETLLKWSRYEGLAIHTRGTGKGKRHHWIVDEVVAFIKATGKNPFEKEEESPDDRERSEQSCTAAADERQHSAGAAIHARRGRIRDRRHADVLQR